MVKDIRLLLRTICPYTTEHPHKVHVLQKYNSKVGMIAIHHLYHYMNQMLKADRTNIQEINMNQEVLSHQGKHFYFRKYKIYSFLFSVVLKF